MSNIFDEPFWNMDVLLTAIRRQRGIANEETTIQAFQRDTLEEVAKLAAVDRLEITGKRCVLKFPDSITSRKAHQPIPIYEFMDGSLWIFWGHVVLTPSA